MALSNAGKARQEAPAAAFEDMEDVAVETAVAEPPKAAPVDAAAAASTAIATAAAGALVTSPTDAKQFAAEVAAMKGAADFSFRSFRHAFKAHNGTISGAEDSKGKFSLGRWVQVTLTAWGEHYEVSPGGQSKSARDFVAYSQDGQVVDSVIGEENRAWVGRKVTDYVNAIKDDFPEAKLRRFIDLACLINDAEKNAEQFAGEIVKITMNPSSIASFISYQQDLELRAKMVARGVKTVKLPEDPFTFYLFCEAAQRGSEEWTKLAVSVRKPVL